MKNKEISIIIPNYNGDKIIEKGIKEIIKVMNNTKNNYEIIIIDDCSKDRSKEIIKDLEKQHKNIIRTILHEKNTGRGEVVNEGIYKAKGNIVGFLDIDLATPAWYIPQFIRGVKEGNDLVIAHRIYKLSPKILLRWLLSKGYNKFMRLALKSKYTDTEAGFKFFNKERIIPVIKEIKDNHWFWDTEIVMRSHFKNYKIKLVPTIFLRKREAKSTLKLYKDTKDYFFNLMRFRKELKRKKLI